MWVFLESLGKIVTLYITVNIFQGEIIVKESLRIDQL